MRAILTGARPGPAGQNQDPIHVEQEGPHSAEGVAEGGGIGRSHGS